MHPLNLFRTNNFKSILGLAFALSLSSEAMAVDFSGALNSAASSISKTKSVAKNMVNAPSIADDPYGTAQGFLVSIEAFDSKGSTQFKQCLGAAITTDAVVTAGHCLTGKGYVRVKFISNLTPIQVEIVEAEGWAIHPLYNGGHPEPMYSRFDVSEAKNYHDIAVILLKNPSQFAVPITTVGDNYDPARKRNITPMFYVFGHARDDRFVPQNGVMMTKFNEVKSYQGTNHWYTGKTTEGVLLCTGDSGSPVTVIAKDEYVPGRNNHYLVGIQTSGDGWGEKPKRLEEALKFWKSEDNLPLCTRDFSFIDIEHHADWIRDELEKLDPANPRDLHVYGQ